MEYLLLHSFAEFPVLFSEGFQFHLGSQKLTILFHLLLSLFAVYLQSLDS